LINFAPLRYKEYKPSHTLEAYVKCFYTIDCDPTTIIEDRAFASGCIEVMFTLQGSQWQTRKGDVFTTTSPVELWGQILQPLSFRASGQSKVFGIRFHPATAAFFLREDINLFNDAVVDLAAVVGHSVLELHEKLQEAQSVHDQVKSAEAYLIKKLSDHPKTIDKVNLVREVMNELTQKDFFDNISTVASRYGITSRYLQKVFVQYTGLTPKLYSQINRFQNSLVLLGTQRLSLTAVAYDCGYSDQSHFIREFKSFTGYVPSGFSPENSTAILASPNK
jgi:AraC-like DNA-binding protein